MSAYSDEFGDPGSIFGDTTQTPRYEGDFQLTSSGYTNSSSPSTPDYTGYGPVADPNYMGGNQNYFSSTPWDNPPSNGLPGSYYIWQPLNQFINGGFGQDLWSNGDQNNILGEALKPWWEQNRAGEEAYNQQQASMSETGGIPYSASPTSGYNLTPELIQQYYNQFGAANNPYASQVVTSPTGESFMRQHVQGQNAPSWDEMAGQMFGMSAMGLMAGAAGAFPGGFTDVLSGASNMFSGLGTNLLSGATSLGQALTGTGAAAAGGLAEEAAALGIGSEFGAGAAAGSLMPAALPELLANNAVPGGVTALSGLDNAVTAGLAGTSGALGGAGAAGLSGLTEEAASLGLSDMFGSAGGSLEPFTSAPLDYSFSSSPLNYFGSNGAFSSAPMDTMSAQLPGGAWNSFGGGGMVDLGGTGSIPGLGQNPFDLSKMFGRDPLKFVGAGMSLLNQYKANQQRKAMMKYLQKNSFPHGNFVGQATEFMQNPQARMDYLQQTPGYLASQAWAQQAAQRRLAAHGDFSGQSGYADATIANTLGQNAFNWDNKLMEYIQNYAGVGQNNTSALAQLMGQNSQNSWTQNLYTGASILNALRSNGLTPSFFSSFFGT